MDTTLNDPNMVLQETKTLFLNELLPFPYIPAELEAQFRPLEPWVFGTRSDTPSLYQLNFFVEEALAGNVKDFFLLGHAGRGINSWAMHYYLVRHPLALFIQSSWGGVYNSDLLDIQKMEMRFVEAEALITVIEDARQSGKWQDGKLLLVVDSDFYGSRWCVCSAGDSPEWHESTEVLEEVCNLVTGDSLR